MALSHIPTFLGTLFAGWMSGKSSHGVYSLVCDEMVLTILPGLLSFFLFPTLRHVADTFPAQTWVAATEAVVDDYWTGTYVKTVLDDFLMTPIPHCACCFSSSLFVHTTSSTLHRSGLCCSVTTRT